jgi:hypothetical protein
LIAATPVIISDQTPWDDLNENNAGWMFALNDEKSFVNSIEELVLMNDSTFSQYRDGAYSYAQNLIDNKDLTSQTKLLFETALQD